MWIFERALGRRGPLMNYSGGTELGGLVATNVLFPIKPASFSGPIPGTAADIVDADGTSVGPGEVGELVMRQACFGTTRGLWRDPERYIESYWSRIPGLWVHGDWASRDADGSARRVVIHIVPARRIHRSSRRRPHRRRDQGAGPA